MSESELLEENDRLRAQIKHLVMFACMKRVVDDWNERRNLEKMHEIIEEWKGNRMVITLAPKYIQYVIYSALLVAMALFGQFGERKFIYFQF